MDLSYLQMGFVMKSNHNILKTSSFNGVYRRFPYYPPGGVARFSAVGGKTDSGLG